MPPNDPDDPDADLADSSPISADELDFSDDDHVRVLDENRYVVSPDAPIDEGEDRPSDTEHPPDAASGTADPGATPHERLRADLEASPHDYGIELSAKLEGRTGTHRTRSDDLVHTFESLLLWLAHYLDDETPPAEVLGILLAESSLTVRYPQGTLREVVEAAGLEPEDSIADLLATVDDDGVTFSGR